MNINPARVTRLQIVFAVIQLFLGLAVYMFRAEFTSSAYALIHAHVPYAAAALMGSGILLLQWRQFRHTQWFRIAAMVAAAPLVVMAINAYAVGAWIGAAFYAMAAVALMAAPWLAVTDTDTQGPDLFAAVVAAAFAVIGGLMVAWPAHFQTAWFYAVIAGTVPWAGWLGFAAAAAVLWPVSTPSRLVRWALQLVSALFPALWLYNWASVGVWSGTVFWGVLTLALLIGDVERYGPAQAADRSSTEDELLLRFERTLEWWTWTLAAIVILLMALVDEEAFTYPRVASWFVAAITIYNVLMHRVLRGSGCLHVRMALHLAFLIASIGVLHVAGGPAGQGYLMLLVIVPPLAASAMGAVWGKRLLLLAVVVVIAGEFFLWRVSGPNAVLVGRTVAKVVVLVAAVTVGIRSAEVFKRQREELADAMATVQYLAKHDYLTDLPNRRYFQQELDRVVAESVQSQEPGAVAVFDLDGFKNVNDSLGHRAGDKLLTRIGDLLRDQVKPPDMLARLGGDEFALLLRGASVTRAQKTVGAVLKSIREYATVLSSHPVRLSASAGIACFPAHGTTSEELLSAADMALSEAKARGRDLYALYVPGGGWQEQAARRRTWEGRIREALATDQFVLECQPIWSIGSARPHQYELLVRMIGPDGSMIPPAAFIPVAEDLGLIHAIDRWVVTRAIDLLHVQHKKGRDITVSVNLSGRSFSDPLLLPAIERRLGHTGVNPGCLVLEITETAAIADAKLAGRLIEHLRAIGCRFALDDFGAGFSSFKMLKRLRFDYLKIDRSFVQAGAHGASASTGDDIDREFVHAMVSIAHGLGQEVVAEGVEDAETLTWIASLGVDYAQGYYLGRPRPVTDPDWVDAEAWQRVAACARTAGAVTKA